MFVPKKTEASDVGAVASNIAATDGMGVLPEAAIVSV